MTRARTLAISGLLVALALGPARAQNVRDTAPRPPTSPTGTVLGGRVVTDEAQPRPVRRAVVTLQAGQLSVPRATVTDDEGRFAFAQVPAGSYSLSASKAGYVRAFYGSRTPGRPPGVPIAVLEGQPITSLVVRLLRGSVIAGLVRRESGQPAANVVVMATLVETVGGERRGSLMTESIPATTDDRGEYRIFGLAPGEYLVAARSGFSVMSGNEARRLTDEELRWADRMAADRTGARASAPAPPEPGPPVLYTTAYYPGTADPAGAVLVAMRPAQERTDVNVTMPLVPTARVSGIVLDPSGAPVANATLQARLRRSSQPVSAIADIIDQVIGRMRTSTGPDGRFSVSGVPPGDYTIQVRANDSPAQQRLAAVAASGAAAAGHVPLFPGGAVHASLWATEDLVIQGRDVSDVTFRLQPGMTVSGRVVYESNTGTPPASSDRSRLVLSPMPTEPGLAGLVRSMTSPTPMNVAEDDVFSAKGVAPGQYRVNTFGLETLVARFMPGAASSSRAGWVLKSAMLGGRDVADAPFDVRPGEDVSGIVVTYTDRPTELSGTVLDQANRATGAFPIVVFSTDRQYWAVGSRRVQLVRPGTDGKFTAGGLPPGEYYVCAVTEANEEHLYEAAFLELLIPGAFTLSLADGEKKVQDLRLAGR